MALLVASILFPTILSAQSQVQDASSAPGIRMSRKADRMDISVRLNMETIEVGNNSLVTLTPMIVSDSDTLSLSTVGLYGRRRWFYYERNQKHIPDAFKDVNFRKNDIPESFTWEEEVAYSDWMRGAQLQILRCRFGCCNQPVEEDYIPLGTYSPFTPKYIFVTPKAELRKERQIQGRAYVDFPVSSTVIQSHYHDNVRELGKITSSIDTLRKDSDIEIISLSIKGFASPESPYDNNTRLAKGRTAALKEYVENLYNFPDSFIKTSYEPEDWDGLEKYVRESNISNKEEILKIVSDRTADPDKREWRLKSRYPSQYKFLLENCYPSLRHSDYVIDYVIRSYTDIEEIRQVFRTSPGKLSLHELYSLASDYEMGSEEFNRVFEVAVTLYPEDPAANLNAASARMQSGYDERVDEYLSKAGDSPEAMYMRGVRAYLKDNLQDARSWFEKAASLGYALADDALKDLDAADYIIH